MAGRLAGRVLLVAGGGADGPPAAGESLPIGIGRAIAIGCAREGARLVVGDIDAARAEETAAAIRDEGGEATAVPVDVADPGDCAAAVRAALERFGALHLLVNNAGISEGGRLLDTSDAEFSHVLDVNRLGQFNMMKAAIPALVRAGGGAVVNVSSIAARRGGAVAAYAASKAAVIALSRTAAVNHATENVRVNAVLPGLIDSTMVRRIVRDREAAALPRIPMGRQGTPWEVARAVAFLLSDDASYVTGTELIVDGGLMAR